MGPPTRVLRTRPRCSGETPAKNAPKRGLRTWGRENVAVSRRCAQTTAAGQPCRARPMSGSDLCASHLRIAHRKTTLTPQVAEQLALVLRSGVPPATAAAAVNVSRSTLHRWLARPEPLYVAFREQVEQARAEGEAALVLRIARESATRWQSAAWLLERIAPARYGRPGDRHATDGEPSDLFADLVAAFHDDAPG